ncbi:MAG: NAD(P)H-dependent oxidoreductase subunit E [Myxococcales bacterium]|nr:NAD(P)H-dependent oxidoreductase subunit E [Myxococcales bacterium]
MSDNLVQLRRRRSDFSPIDNALSRLKSVMHDRREITRDDVEAIARAVHQPTAAVYGVATYYGDLGLAKRGRLRVKVCRGTACFATAGESHVGWLEEALGLGLGETRADGSVSLESVYCLGFCNAGPALEIEGRIYGGLTPEIARALAAALDDAAAGRGPVPEAHGAHAPAFVVHGGPAIVLERLAAPIDASHLDTAVAHDAFAGLAKALSTMTPEEVLASVERSGLRGRGGAGFPTATKWRFAADNAKRASEGYVVCNADEGDPGSYIDKYVMERDPFALIEGLALAAYASHATKGFVYVRSEYPLSKPVLDKAVFEARNAGWLGKNIRGSSFSFDVEVVTGAGSYVCGEETALLRSLEGLRGMVTARPPFPAERGLFGKPTIVNNVETLANLGWIVRNGGEAYAALGVGKSRGTKALSVNERFVRPGIYEVPLGTPLRTVLVELAGGLKDGRPIKAVQIGGPLGGVLPERLLDTPIGFEELDAVGALLGHGGVVAWDDRVDARDIAEHLFEFCDAESCGKCFPCRIGGRRGLEIVRRLKARRPADEVARDVGLLTELCETMKLGSLCAHGGAIPIPIASLLTHFEREMTGGAT